jgi:hypothetical protein
VDAIAARPTGPPSHSHIWQTGKGATQWVSLLDPLYKAGTIGDQFTLSAVILAASLLLAALASRFEWEELRAVVAGASLVMLLFCVIRLLTLPIA